MSNTVAKQIFDSFESTFQDKVEIPENLELLWLLKAIGQFSIEVDTLNFDKDTLEFDCELSRYVIDILAMYMKLYYQERQVSKVNKRASIVTKDFSFDGTNGTKTAEKAHLEWVKIQLAEMLNDLKPTAYS